jgi:hypothetical protein
VESVGGCGVGLSADTLTSTSIRLRATDRSAPGRNFADSAALAARSFNESYYLNRYFRRRSSRAVRTVPHGSRIITSPPAPQKGYRKSAPAMPLPVGLSLWSDNKAYRVTHQEYGNVVFTMRHGKPMWFYEHAGATGGVLRDAERRQISC